MGPWGSVLRRVLPTAGLPVYELMNIIDASSLVIILLLCRCTWHLVIAFMYYQLELFTTFYPKILLLLSY